MFNIFGGDDDGPITDRADIIKLLQVASRGDIFELQFKFGQRRKLAVTESEGRRLKVVSDDEEFSRYIDTQSGMVLDPDDDTEFGIKKVWPSESMREMLSQMEA